MKLSTRSRYGTRLLLDMARHYEEGPVQLGAIAGREGIPVKYLEQIIIPLKKAKYVESIRGARGGHRLARSPDSITVGEIVSLLERGFKLTNCVGDAKSCSRSESCATRAVWQEATEAMLDRLHKFTLSDLLKRDQAE
jgi:Rrf2 family transcriptional regulator, iron-sulfur cluster assembly transcription factor